MGCGSAPLIILAEKEEDIICPDESAVNGFVLSSKFSICSSSGLI